MPLLSSVLIFVLVAGVAAFAGLKLWLKPKEAIERVTGISVDPGEHTPVHPSLIFHDMLKRLGNILPANPKDASVVQRRLTRAGIRGSNAIKILYGCRVGLGVALPLLAMAAVYNMDTDSSNKVLAITGAAALGFFGPNEFITMKAKKRQKQIRRGLPNALDLMVVCVESGLGLDQAILQVAKELEQAHGEISEEFTFVNIELKAGARRAEALRNLADRTAVDDLKKLVAVLIQADRFGTGIAQSLRAHSEYMRIQARQIAEEKAAKLGVKLVFPIFFCILPSLFVVTVGPVICRIMRDLLPMMNNM
ncbi:MAG: type II secretion system F family protein [Acidobacteria bacterium]|nr:type II secretion system F family protein [Acidobacteriota bacterium]